MRLVRLAAEGSAGEVGVADLGGVVGLHPGLVVLGVGGAVGVRGGLEALCFSSVSGVLLRECVETVGIRGLGREES